MAPVAVLIESATRKTFACALDWPGWARSGRSIDDAMDALESYRDRYTAVLVRSGVEPPTGAMRVVERVRGGASTEFGVPGAIADADRRVIRGAQRARLASCMTACWEALGSLEPRELRLGPRGGGRSFDRIVRHVEDAEVAYARGLGLRATDPKGDRAAVDALRARLRAVVAGEAEPDREGKWPVRYAARRIAWHALDHCFEIEDRTIA